MNALGKIAQATRDYAAHPDGRTALANALALFVASSQPFYPLYLYWTVSPTVWPTAVTFLSTPFFLAVPAVSRRNSAAGRGLFVLAGIANTIASAWAFGVASGVEVFLIPCIVLALLLFRRRERRIAWSIAGLALAAYPLFHTRYGAPLHLYDAEEYAAFARLNFMSAAGLAAIVSHRMAALFAAAEDGDP